jgi:hypothetical protein
MVSDTVSTLERLPQLLSRAEAVAEALSDSQTMKSSSRRDNETEGQGRRPDWLLYVLIAVIVGLLAANL